ncbi:ABC transporter permease [Sphaerimonospora sp. CA-214678]|uniref:ABC transporter permease n=1 Tax=Sphaerimonospora sp. CA-214678 TaxID=3240029 RepID=UPI003D90C7B6
MKSHPLLRFVLVRVAALPFTILAVLSISFLVTSVLPVDPAKTIAGPMATDEVVAGIRARLGLDRPLIERFTDYLGSLLGGDLGSSYATGQPVSGEIAERLPATLTLILPALALAAVVGIGVIGGYYAGRRPASASGGIVTVLQAVPDFLLALVLIVVFATGLGVLPGPEGQLSIGTDVPPKVTGSIPADALLAGQWSVFADAVRHLILPVLTLGLTYSALIARISRALLGNALAMECVRFARACGWSEWRVVRSALLIARVPLLTYTAMLLAGLIGGAAIIEKVFSWGGFGQWTVDSMQKVDLPVIQAIVLFAGGATVVVYLAMDVLSGLLDPRIPIGRGNPG